MTFSPYVQGSPEWFLERCGIPTASMFSHIITSKGDASTSSTAYMNQLLAEWVAQKPVDAWKGNKFCDMGHEREPEARDLYCFLKDAVVDEVGICFRDERKLVGASLDGIVVDGNGCLEIKNPKGSTVIGYVLKDTMPSIYVPQVQGQLWVTGLDWCDFMVYHPDLGNQIFHVERDERYIAQMSGRVNKFNENMIKKRIILKERLQLDSHMVG